MSPPTSRHHRGRHRPGLFDNPLDAEKDNPRERRCPHCKADIAQPCTVHGRAMRNYHPARSQEQQ